MPRSSTVLLMQKFGLQRAKPESLTIRRQRSGRGFVYVRGDETRIRDGRLLRRLASLAVPPAYENVMFTEIPNAHLQAVGRDSAGRVQYRYHPDWEKVRETRKAERLLRLVTVLPKIRRAMAARLSGPPTREFALAALVDLVGTSGIRAGSAAYARLHGTRGAATLLKSDIHVKNGYVILAFPAKGGQKVEKQIHSPRLAGALKILRRLPGRYLFQYRDEAGAIRKLRRRDANAFLRKVAGVRIALKDFRTLIACGLALETLAKAKRDTSERKRRRQVGDALLEVAGELINTPTVCRKSYVHKAVVLAFENGALEKLARKNGHRSGLDRREAMLAQLLGKIAV